MADRGMIDAEEKGALKDLIVRSDARVLAVCAAYERSGRLQELLDALERLAAVARREAAVRRSGSMGSRGGRR
jgi:hypothetical protein